MPNPTSYTWIAVADNVPPTVYNVEVVDAFTLRVIYSEPVVEAEALDIGHYGFTGGLVALSVAAESPTAFLVTTTVQTSGTSYTLTVSNVHDLNGNLI